MVEVDFHRKLTQLRTCYPALINPVACTGPVETGSSCCGCNHAARARVCIAPCRRWSPAAVSRSRILETLHRINVTISI